MARPIGWNKRDPELGKLKIEARFFGDKLTLYRQLSRFEEWETFTPDEEDWDILTKLAENKFNRGKVKKKHMQVILARGDKV
ncbi:MAG: hypothetical protein OSB19_09660 [Opitutaceae bacterium]|jgi:hypothetical protein|nr:hypothetical protein [Opitutaceae bacterium]|tara:strand:- start:1592 stop:1837 length:246 start_codon:yes stop_codon:yes gene_type:complete